MFRSGWFRLMVCAGLAAALTACEQTTTAPSVEADARLARSAAPSSSSGFDDAVVAELARRIDDFNGDLARAGSDLRLDYPWMFVVGGGTDPFQQLRTGARWQIESPGYILDASDYTTDLPAAEVEATLVAAYEAWNAVGQSYLNAVREADDGTNFDVLDGTFDAMGECVDVFDITSPNLDLVNGFIFPAAHIVVGGWVTPDYFELCLGSENILGVTWTFSGPDTDGDQYRDRLYVEQFYNPAFTWVTSGSIFLTPATGVDLESVAVHENGHTHGLGHFGGPVRNQPFTLKPNGRVFNPEAVMNPFYLYGEKRTPLTTDVAGLLTMYAAKR